MADLKISQLTSASLPLAGTEVLPIVQSSTTKKVATDDLTVKNVRSNATTGILQIAGPAAAATRTMTVPDANFTAARTDAAQSFTGNQTLDTGNIIQGTAAKGINFTANTPAAGMTSQLLNWYEEGTATITITPTSGTVTLNSSYNTMLYTRVGRMVTVTGNPLVQSVSTPSGAFTIDGLPYAAKATTGTAAATIFLNGIASSSLNSVVAYVNQGATKIGVYTGTGTSLGTGSAALLQANSEIYFTLTYFV